MSDIFIPVTTAKGIKKQIAAADLPKALKLNATIDGTDADGFVPMVTGKGVAKRIAPHEVSKALGLGATFGTPEPVEVAEPVVTAAPAVASPLESAENSIKAGLSADDLPEAERAAYLQAHPPAHDSGLDRARTFFEGTAKGAAVGMSSPIEYAEGASNWIGNKAYEALNPGARSVGFTESLGNARQDINDRAAASPLLHGTGQLAGAIIPGLATGGTSLIARGASYAPSALLSSAAARAGAGVAAGTGWKWAGNIVQGAVEGAGYGAAQHDRDIENAIRTGDYDGLSEKVLAGAENGAMLGGAFSLGGDLAQKAGGALVGKVKKLINEADLGNFAANRAYKQALGGRNVTAVKQADKYLGGTDAVGKTLIREGVVTPTSTVEEIAESAGRIADERGQVIGQLVDEFDSGIKASKSELMARIQRNVLDRLNKTPTGRKLAEGIVDKLGYELDALVPQSQLAQGSVSIPRAAAAADDTMGGLMGSAAKVDDGPMGGLIGSVPGSPAGSASTARQTSRKGTVLGDDGLMGTRPAPPDELSLRELWERRVMMDKTLAKWEKNVADPSTEGVRDVVREFRGYFDDLAEQAASKVGRPELKTAYDLARREYSHLKHAEKVAAAAVQRDKSNAFFSLTDYMSGLATMGAASQDGLSPESLAYGFLATAGNKFARKQLSGMAAKVIDRAGKKSAMQLQRSVDVLAASADDLAKAAAKTQKRINVAAKLKGLISGAGAKIGDSIPKALTFQGVQQLLTDMHPESPATQEFYGDLENMSVESPELAENTAAKREAASAFLLSKAGPEPTNAMGQVIPRDPVAMRILQRYAHALKDPTSALERMGDGNATDEDRETLQAVYPRMHQEFIAKAMESVDEKTPYKKRLLIAHSLGVPIDSTMAPSFIADMQASAVANRPQEQQKASGGSADMGQGTAMKSDRLGAR